MSHSPSILVKQLKEMKVPPNLLMRDVFQSEERFPLKLWVQIFKRQKLCAVNQDLNKGIDFLAIDCFILYSSRSDAHKYFL